MATYKKRPAKSAGFVDRVTQNFDIVLATLGGVIVLTYLGFPLIKQTTVITPAKDLSKK